MLTHIFGNPSDSNYSTQYAKHLTSIRRLASSDLLSVLTDSDLPDDLIQDIAYLGSAEAQVLTDTKLSVEAVNTIIAGTDKVKQLNLQYLLIVGTVIRMLPQIIQIVSQKIDDVDIDLQEIDWQKKETFLTNQYSLTIIKITPTATTVKGSININVAGTSSRVDR